MQMLSFNLQAAKIGIESKAYQDLGRGQIGYILGDTGRSFVVGVGVNPPTHPHHRASYELIHCLS